jgi:hypothetical protein
MQPLPEDVVVGGGADCVVVGGGVDCAVGVGAEAGAAAGLPEVDGLLVLCLDFA